MQTTNNLPKAKTKFQKATHVFFDLDGTLLDLEKLNFMSYSIPFKQTLNIDLTEKQYFAMFSGKTRHLGVKDFLENQKINHTKSLIQNLVSQGTQIKQEMLESEEITKYVHYKPNAREFLFSIFGQKKMALVTSTQEHLTKIILKRLELNKFFDLVITAGDITKGKPDPEPYIKALQFFNISSALVFEDSKGGILSAKRANCFVIGIYTPSINDNWIELADAWITDFKILL